MATTSEAVVQLCNLLDRLGCIYELRGDNRVQHLNSRQFPVREHRSRYIYVSRPKYIEIRVSDHKQNKIRRRKTFDVGPHGLSLEQAVGQIEALVKA